MPPPHTDPAVRADARRNRELVLAAAQRAFAERGMSVSLMEIARRAGVGAGTVHRHFPTKNDLLAAVLRQRIERLTDLAVRSRERADVGRGFFDFCLEVVTSTPGNKAMCDVLDGDDDWPSTALVGVGARFRHAVAELLGAAQRQGTVRSDLTVSDVLTIFTGCVAMQRGSGVRRGLSRPVAIMVEAMRAEAPGVTKRGTAGDGRAGTVRDEKAFRDDAESRCPICAAAVPRARTGRPARYCSAACRQKAHRDRVRGAG
ncbi:TetR family transcriptional regulator [Nocardia otitidiscaviarum]|uniref:TetR family transcriptional regulator n=1 Tax=Nocardia otitidiscaviarum TaxID=1823 RepID=A0A516NPP0_9NOCA|nr:TetR/AcrR family transcriptional regulator [Nocardia otitidiscaviarum]MCP9623826.1 TetR/AcrR family transcriptional regulator [Nocardia otitidiscaviarum]QDP80877.1 TetR family transcriptional regulator [Nocardia otitidiscaviarum]